MAKERPEYIDLYSGCGGLALGMHQAGWKALFAVEKNEDAFETLRYNLIEHDNHFNWPEWLPQTAHDINDLLISHGDELKKLRGKIALVTGGPPCQGFSSAGLRNEADVRNTLVDSYLDFIDLVEPESVLFENVRGFTQAFKASDSAVKGKKYSDYVIKELELRGYTVGHEIINFSKFGVPQRRYRFILFASIKYQPDKFFSMLNRNVKDFLKQKKLSKTVSIKSALSDLEIVNGTIDCPDSERFKSGKYGSAKTKYQQYCRAGARKGDVPDSHRLANHREKTVKRFNELQELNIRNRNISKLLEERYGIDKHCFSVLDARVPAPTLTSNPDDYLHYCEARTLSVREYARIQSFPDWYCFRGKYTTGGKERKNDVPRYTQIGNAIPPLMAEQIGLTLIKLTEETADAS
jgi:DNA (cytosine-5)-methyltransferase 1